MMLQDKGHDVIVVRCDDVAEATALVMAALGGKSQWQ
jgi:hypothetical protein